MTVPVVARDHRADQVALSRRARRDAQELWGRVEADRLRPSYEALLPSLLRMVAAAQVAAAALSVPYLDRLLGAEAPPVAEPQPQALAGVASDGRDLVTLLLRPLVTVLGRIAQGDSPGRAMASGLVHLDMIVRTQVADAARVADQVALTARPACVAYTRVVELPACARCIILAGRTYPWSTGFQRHPQCDCAMRPMRPGETAPGISPRALFAEMSPEEQRRRFGAGGAEAIRLGADMAQVVNARRGMSAAGSRRRGRYTTEGTTARGVAGRRLGDLAGGAGRYRRSRRPRLMPDAIIREARTRDHAIELLREHGYLT